jgi:hypothetical protein
MRRSVHSRAAEPAVADDITRMIMERDIQTAVPDFFEKAPQMEELLLGEGFSEDTIRNMIGSTGRKRQNFSR